MKLLREVAERVNRPFEVKLAETKEVIRHHFEEFPDNKVAVAFSGGKDSEVVLWLCLQINPNVPVIFNNTGVEYPETIDFIAKLTQEWRLNLIVEHPEKSFWSCVEEFGFAERKTGKSKGRAYCCRWLKEKPMLRAIRREGWLGYFTGETATENRNRMFWARDRGMCLHLKVENVCKIKPILWWTQDEVRKYIHYNNLPLNEAYNKGAERVGCMPCTAHKKWEEQMRKVNPKLYEIIKLRKDSQYVMRLGQ